MVEGRHLVVHLGFDLDAAFFASAVVAQPGGHVVAGGDELLRFEPQLLHRLVDPFEEPNDLFDAPAGVRALVRRQHPVDLGIE